MFEFSVTKPVILTVAVLIVCVFGVNAVYRLPKQMIPDLDARVISVRTSWPGATPQDVEKEIVVEQEDYLRNIPNLERMVSNASTGQARIELEFPHGVDLNDVLIRVNNSLSQVPQYPENVDEPRIVTSSTSDNPFMFFRITPQPGNPKNVNVNILEDFIRDHVATRLERISGVSEVEVWGGSERQIKIHVDPARLAERGITLLELRDAIRGRNRDVSGGDLDSGKRRYIVRTLGRFQDVEEINKLLIARRNDISIRLEDVGYAELDSFEVRTMSYANGVPNVTLGVRRMIGANVVTVMDDVMLAVDTLNAGTLGSKGLRMNLSSEDVQYVKDAMSVVVRNLLIGAVLSIVVLYLFLASPGATIIGAMGIPICTVVAFLGLMLAGRTINVISLAGVAFAIGMTLDNSIVVLENIHRHLREGKDRFEAAIGGVTEVWPAILASTLTTVFVFLPVIFINEEAGQLYSDIAIAIAASILMSMVVAVTLVPAAAGRYLSISANPPTQLQIAGGQMGNAIIAFVSWIIDSTARRILLIGLVVGLSVSTIMFLTPKAEYLPEGEEQKIFAFMFAPPGYNVASMDVIMRELNDYLVPFIGADPSDFDSGRTTVPALNYMFGYARAGSILLIPEATDRSQVDDLVDAVSKRFRAVPGVIAFASRGSIFASNTGGSRSINLDISGTDLVSLFDVGFQAFRQSKQIFDNPQVRPQPSNLTMGQPLLEIRPDWERAAELGLDTAELGYSIWAFTDGAYVDEFFLGDDKIDMFLYSTDGSVERPEDIGNVLLYSQTGGAIPLNAIATITETVNTATIRRVDGQRTITLSIIPPREIPLEVGVSRVQKMLIDDLGLAGNSDITMRISGANDSLLATRAALRDNFLIAILIAYLLLVAIFSHWGYPLFIMLTVPIGISGGIVGLWLMNFVGGNLDAIGVGNIHQPLDVITMLGFLVLIGTVVNNPILIVEKSLTNIRNGLSTAEAVLDSTRSRLQPIVMSTITTVFGLSPLIIYPGAGTELYRGLGAIVLFGLLFSSIVTITFMPALLTLVLDSRLRLFNVNNVPRTSV
jgi:multidrug efflux pump subunit AcrB